jgi:hypothetical protein
MDSEVSDDFRDIKVDDDHGWDRRGEGVDG